MVGTAFKLRLTAAVDYFRLIFVYTAGMFNLPDAARL
jgi:hypothetical protein